ncbi:hypothetical protein H0H92_006574 [Tricholoma furcatifolium]|nr:hypothetical protein H0H92_006574 [Tricholoma furcatifolium]
MLDRPADISSNESSPVKPTSPKQKRVSNHGLPNNRILDAPSEILTAITAYLNPPCLLSLARVHSRLAAHVQNDNTWHRAFVCQFLGISPEGEIRDDVKSLMIRRSESTWRNEFIVHYRLRRRWERSRNTTITHVPVHSQVSSMYLMPNTGLLSSSIHYGIVSRSLPLSGKILSGYLDASGLRLGRGVGNPNAEFTPDISVCSVSSDGGTARILWGFRNGEVGILTAPRAIDAAKRPVTEYMRCDIIDEHVGGVLDAAWDVASSVVASAGADGTVKLWDSKTMQCLWTSQRNEGPYMPDACLNVAVSLSQGVVVTVLKSGKIVIWTDLQFNGGISSAETKEIRIPCPVPLPDSLETEESVHRVSILRIDAQATIPTILVVYEDDPFFYRISITSSGTVEKAIFGDDAFGALSCVVPFFSSSPNEASFVLTGDRMGCVNVYAWNSHFSSTPIHCVRKFEAYEDGAPVTAIAWNSVTLITGSGRGTTVVWDGLTFEYLRSFSSPVPRIRVRGNHGERNNEPVRQIIIGPEKETLLVSVADRVMAWVAGPVPKNSSGGVRGRHAVGAIKNKNREGTAKYLEQVELHQTISESQSLLQEESKQVQMVYGREREHRAMLETMGLDEGEALEYILMLSREEALQHEISLNPAIHEEGVFDNFDFDGIPSNLTHLVAGPSGSTPSNSGMSTPKRTPRHSHRASPSHSNEKVQVSPPFRPEPMEAGNGDVPLTLPPLSLDSSDEKHFPRMSTSASPPSPTTHRAWSISRSNISRTSSIDSQGSARVVVAGSPMSRKSPAWAGPSQSPAVPRSPQSVKSFSQAVPSQNSVARNLPSVPSSPSMGDDDELDDELRFVLELSLAEARSRGEDV